MTTAAATGRVSLSGYRLGGLYALVSATLFALQEPFAATGARKLSMSAFICVTQLTLLAVVPMLVRSRADFAELVSLLRSPKMLARLLVIFAVGLTGLWLYNLGLSRSNPIIVAAILNVSPFWAALIAKVLSNKPVPTTPLIFFGCFLVAFAGVICVAYSQMQSLPAGVHSDLFATLAESRWLLALPIPLFFALSGTLICKWFYGYREGPAVSANFVVSATLLIPVTAWFWLSDSSPAEMWSGGDVGPMALLVVGTMAGAAFGRFFYQVALRHTDDDNGFVTMFFLSTPVISSLVSWLMSFSVPAVKFEPNALFFLGLVLVIAPLALFSSRSLNTSP